MKWCGYCKCPASVAPLVPSQTTPGRWWCADERDCMVRARAASLTQEETETHAT